MTDFAANIIAALTASSSDRARTAKTIIADVDRDGDGKLSGAEFQKVFAVLQRAEDLAGGKGAGRSPFSSAGARPTIFDCTLYPSFSQNYAISQYQAAKVLSAFDKDNDKVITLDELSGVAASTTPADGAGGTDAGAVDPTSGSTTPPPPPGERADALMAQYDAAKKGYVTVEDIAAAWIKDPTLGDLSQLANIAEAWDANADGKITRQEIVSIFTVMDNADAMLAQMGETPQGAEAGAERVINLAHVTDAQLTQIDMPRETLASWDANKDGALTRAELIDGLRALAVQNAPTPTAAEYAQAMLAQFDANTDGALSLDEFEKAVATEMDAAAAKNSFEGWDVNQDGSVSADELTSGVDAAQRAMQIMQGYDLDKKGYFTLADLQRVLDESADKNTRASAADIMAVWDLDGDGRVTTQEVVDQLLLQKAAQPGDGAPPSDTTLPTV